MNEYVNIHVHVYKFKYLQVCLNGIKVPTNKYGIRHRHNIVYEELCSDNRLSYT